LISAIVKRFKEEQGIVQSVSPNHENVTLTKL